MQNIWSKTLVFFSSGAILSALWLLVFFNFEHAFSYKPETFSKDSLSYKVAEKYQLTDRSRDVLYSTRPIILSEANFGNSSNITDTQTLKVGSYNSAENRIYILNLYGTDKAGEVEKTLLHETFHAIYLNLLVGELEHLNPLLIQSVKNNGLEPMLEPYQDNSVIYYSEAFATLGTDGYILSPDLHNFYTKFLSL